MSIFEELGKLYTEIDNIYAGKEIHARSLGQRKKELEFSRKRELNDAAYFLFMFTRLEDRVRSLSDKLIDKKVASLSNWKNKRTWEIIHKQKVNDSLHFMNRLALLTQVGNTNYNLIQQYYKQRNNIGHGGNFSITISIPTVISNLKAVYNSLR